MEGVSLRYDESLGPVIRDIDLRIPAGSKVCPRELRIKNMHYAYMVLLTDDSTFAIAS